MSIDNKFKFASGERLILLTIYGLKKHCFFLNKTFLQHKCMYFTNFKKIFRLKT